MTSQTQLSLSTVKDNLLPSSYTTSQGHTAGPDSSTATQLVTCDAVSVDPASHDQPALQYVFLDQSDLTEQTEIVEETGNFNATLTSSNVDTSRSNHVVLNFRTVAADSIPDTSYLQQTLESNTSSYAMS